MPIILASSSVSVLLRYVFFTLNVFPEGRTAPVTGMGGSPSFCCKLSAITKKARKPMFILSGLRLKAFAGFPTQRKSKIISFIAKSKRSWAMNWMIFTKMFRGISLGTTPRDPLSGCVAFTFNSNHVNPK